jgi:hypothetical protein
MVICSDEKGGELRGNEVWCGKVVLIEIERCLKEYL